jgi:RHS repeat-associated protein
VQPKLSLTYHSHIGNGLLGVGWQLNGLSVITRIQYGRAFDYKLEAEGRGQFEYLGPGGRLVDVSGTRSLFHSENENWAKYIPIKDPSSIAPEPLSYWRVEDNGGTTLFYGLGPLAAGRNDQARRAVPGQSGHVRAWYLSRFQDPHGNFYDVRYGQNVSTGAHYPLEITYTGGPGVKKLYRVSFEYEARPDVSETYFLNSRESLAQRLKWIVITWETSLVRKYRLDYETGRVTGRSRLVRTQEYGHDGATTFPPLEFQYTDGDIAFADPQKVITNPGSFPSWRTTAGDFNGDGRSDIAFVNEGTVRQVEYALAPRLNELRQVPTLFSLGAPQGSRILAADVNGDSRSDLLVVAHSPDGRYVRQALWNGDGFGALTTVVADDRSFEWDWVPVPCDLNGDMRTDLALVYQGGKGRRVRFLLAGPNGLGATLHEADNLTITDPIGLGWTVAAGDVDGDSSQDLIFGRFHNNVWKVEWALRIGDASFTNLRRFVAPGPNITVPSLDAAAEALKAATSWRIHPAEINGDGKTDLVLVHQSPLSKYVQFALSTGNGFTDIRCSQCSTSASNTKGSIVADFNSDGLTDVLLREVEDGNLRHKLFLSNGQGFSSASQESLQLAVIPGDAEVIAADEGGTGKHSILVAVHGEYGRHVWVAPLKPIATNSFASPYDVLVRVRSPSGGDVEAVYLPAPLVHNAIVPQERSSTDIVANTSPRNLVTTVHRRDGRGHTYTQRFEYYAGRFRAGRVAERDNLGFQVVTEVNAITGEYSQVTYHQHGVFAKQPEIIRTGIRGGQLKTRTQVKYVTYGACDETGCTRGESSPPYMVRSDTSHSITYDPILQRELFRTVTASAFDAWGSQIKLTVRTSSPGGVELDRRIATKSYVNDRARNAIGLITETMTCADNACLKKLTHLRSYYDNLPLGQVGSRGLLTKQEKLLLSTGVWSATDHEYDEWGNPIRSGYPNGTVVTKRYDTRHRSFVVASTTPAGDVFQSPEESYDFRFGTSLRTIDPNGLTTTMSVDVFGRRILKTARGPTGSPLWTESMIYRDGRVSSHNRSVTTCRREGQTKAGICSTEYVDALGRIYMREHTGEEGRTVRQEVEFDEAGRGWRVAEPHLATTAPSAFTETFYDDAGRTERIRGPDGRETRYGYNDAPLVEGAIRSVSQVDEANVVTRRWFDHTGNVVQSTRGVGLPDAITVTYSYDAVGRLKATRDPLGNVSELVYDGSGRVTGKLIPGLGAYRYFYHDTPGTSGYEQLATLEAPAPNEPPNSPTTVSYQHSYDNAARYTGYTTSTGAVLQIDYGKVAPARGRVTRIKYSSEGASVLKEFTYTVLGDVALQKISIAEPGQPTREYQAQLRADGLHRPQLSLFPDGKGLRYCYSQATALLTAVGPSDSRCGSGNEFAAVAHYNQRSQADHVVYGNQVHNILGHDAATGFFFARRTPLPDLTASWFNFDILRNAAGAVRKIDYAGSDTMDTQFLYDHARRLTTAASTTGGTFSYAYDLAGNLTSNAASVQHFGPGNLLLSSARTDETFVWSGAGTMLSRVHGGTGSKTAYIYGDQARLQRIDHEGNEVARFYYDEQGRRVLKVVTARDGIRRTFYPFPDYEERELWQGGTRVATQVTRYITANGYRLAAETAGELPGGIREGMVYFHADHLGSTTLVTDAAGVEVAKFFYEPYGHLDERRSKGHEASSFRFAGHEYDFDIEGVGPGGLYYFGARYYDPKLGIFITADPIAEVSPRSEGSSRFTYALGNPATNVDPTGLFAVDETSSQGCKSFGETDCIGTSVDLLPGSQEIMRAQEYAIQQAVGASIQSAVGDLMYAHRHGGNRGVATALLGVVATNGVNYLLMGSGVSVNISGSYAYSRGYGWSGMIYFGGNLSYGEGVGNIGFGYANNYRQDGWAINTEVNYGSPGLRAGVSSGVRAGESGREVFFGSVRGYTVAGLGARVGYDEERGTSVDITQTMYHEYFAWTNGIRFTFDGGFGVSRVANVNLNWDNMATEFMRTWLPADRFQGPARQGARNMLMRQQPKPGFCEPGSGTGLQECSPLSELAYDLGFNPHAQIHDAFGEMLTHYNWPVVSGDWNTLYVSQLYVGVFTSVVMYDVQRDEQYPFPY